jgi:hypothetical protein
MHSLHSSSHSYTSSQQISSRSSQQSSVSYMSSESSSNKVWQVQCTSAESSVAVAQVQRLVASPHHTEQNVGSDVARSVSPVAETLLNIPPALPEKTRSKHRRDRQLSTYDNVQSDTTDETRRERRVQSCSVHQSQSIQHGSCHSPDGKPPPLPLKKKHSECYMAIFVCVDSV